MSGIRNLASCWLRYVMRHAPAKSAEWAAAMLGELESIESDWGALLWALGSTAAVFKCTVHEWMEWLGRKSAGKENPMPNRNENRTIGILAGAGIAGMLVVFAFGVVDLLFHVFPKWDLGPIPWWVAVIVIPEIIFVVSVVALWRRRRPMALGILLTAIILATHFAVHLATHFH
jgi:hypothetical protein